MMGNPFLSITMGIHSGNTFLLHNEFFKQIFSHFGDEPLGMFLPLTCTQELLIGGMNESGKKMKKLNSCMPHVED